jgi:hypothetical protein
MNPGALRRVLLRLLEVDSEFVNYTCGGAGL